MGGAQTEDLTLDSLARSPKRFSDISSVLCDSKSNLRLFLAKASADQGLLSDEEESPEDVEGLGARLRPPKKAYWLMCMTTILYGMFFNGIIYGYSSPALISLQSNTSSLTLSDEEASWVSSLPGLGFPLGTLASGLLMKILGRKLSTLLIHCSSYILGFGLIFWAEDVSWIYAGRLSCGVCQGVCNCIILVYTLELCLNQKQRAIAGVLLSVSGYSGTLITYILGVFLDWRQLALASMLFAIPFVMGMIFIVPESPQYHIMRGQRIKALKIRSKLYGSVNSWSYLQEQSQNSSTFTTNDEFKGTREPPPLSKSMRKLTISMVLVLFYQFAGYNIINFYAASILKSDEQALFGPLGGEASPVMNAIHQINPALTAAVCVAFGGLLGVLGGVYLVQKLHRKTLLMTSALGTSIAFLALGAFYVAQDSLDLEQLSPWLSLGVPTFLLIVHLQFFSIGYGSSCYPIMAELLPTQLRPLGMSLVSTMGGIFAFANTKSFNDINALWGKGATFLIYGAINLIGAMYIWLFIPHHLQSRRGDPLDGKQPPIGNQAICGRLAFKERQMISCGGYLRANDKTKAGFHLVQLADFSNVSDLGQ
eukprot:maker-scaffold294_size218657-snap-gene-1.27 protein:Tk10443 transcript:maker-scaffold294_size218657-snap-gene-1.27-mRNA-1 annotation:"sugar transporter 8"